MGYITKGAITLDTVNDAYTVSLTKQSCVIHADFDGSNPNLSDAYTYIKVLRGDKVMPFNCKSLLSDTEQIGISITNNNRVEYLLKINSIPDNLQGEIPLSITTDDGYITTISFNYTVVRESSMLDWIQDWEGGKTKIGSTYIMTPKMFIGKKSQFAQYGPDGSNPKNDVMSIPGLTGVYIGPDQDSTGIYGYKNSVEIFHLNSAGGMIGGWDINNGGIQSKDGYLKILSDGHITTTNADGIVVWELDSQGNAKFALGNILFNADGSAKFKGRIESSEGIIGGWEINNVAIFNTQVGLNSANKYIAIANISSIPTINGLWDGNHLAWVKAHGGVAMYYTSNADFGFIAYKGTNKTFSAGSTNFIAGWNFDRESLYLGTKANTSGAYASKFGITIGSNGIRSYKCRFETDGSGAIAGGKISWNSEGVVTFASDVSLNWSNISGAIGNKLTKIDSNGVYTGTVSANNITAGTIIGSAIKQAATSPKWSLNSDGSGSLAGGNISWTSTGNVTVQGSITATSGSIGGFTIGTNRIGSTATSSGSGGSLAIYDDFLRVGSTNGYVMFGDDVVPSSAGGAFTAAGRIVNTHPNTYGSYGFDQANYGLFISVSGGTKNYGISSNAALMAPAFINTKAKLLTLSGSTYSIDFSQNNIILLYYNNPNYSGVDVSLPTESSVASQFGLSYLPTDFAATVIFRVRTGSKRITLKGIYNHNEGTQDYPMEAGDSVMLLITKADGFRYQILNYTS